MRDAAKPGVVANRPRDLNQRAKSIVDRAGAGSEGRQEVRLRVVASGTAATTEEVRDSAHPTVIAERVEDERLVSAAEYRVG